MCMSSYMGSDTAMYEVLLFLLLYPAYECVACFVLWNCMDVNRNTIVILLYNTCGFIRPGVRLIMHASPLMPGIIVLHAMICARSSEYRPERGFQAKAASIL